MARSDACNQAKALWDSRQAAKMDRARAQNEATAERKLSAWRSFFSGNAPETIDVVKIEIVEV